MGAARSSTGAVAVADPAWLSGDATGGGTTTAAPTGCFSPLSPRKNHPPTPAAASSKPAIQASLAWDGPVARWAGEAASWLVPGGGGAGGWGGGGAGGGDEAGTASGGAAGGATGGGDGRGADTAQGGAGVGCAAFAGASRAPQLLQNLAVGPLEAPQLAQAGALASVWEPAAGPGIARAIPQPLQNFTPSRFSLPHPVHTSAMPSSVGYLFIALQFYVTRNALRENRLSTQSLACAALPGKPFRHRFISVNGASSPRRRHHLRLPRHHRHHRQGAGEALGVPPGRQRRVGLVVRQTEDQALPSSRPRR